MAGIHDELEPEVKISLTESWIVASVRGTIDQCDEQRTCVMGLHGFRPKVDPGYGDSDPCL